MHHYASWLHGSRRAHPFRPAAGVTLGAWHTTPSALRASPASSPATSRVPAAERGPAQRALDRRLDHDAFLFRQPWSSRDQVMVLGPVAALLGGDKLGHRGRGPGGRRARRAVAGGPSTCSLTIFGESGTTRTAGAGFAAALSVRIARATPPFTNRTSLTSPSWFVLLRRTVTSTPSPSAASATSAQRRALTSLPAMKRSPAITPSRRPRSSHRPDRSAASADTRPALCRAPLTTSPLADRPGGPPHPRLVGDGADAPSAPGRRNSSHPIASPAQARQLRPWPSDVDRSSAPRRKPAPAGRGRTAGYGGAAS